MNIKAALGLAERYEAEHEAPDWERLVGSPVWKQRIAYVRKQIIDIVNTGQAAFVLTFVPDPEKYYISGGLALVLWIFHYKAVNGPAPQVKDNTAWVAASHPPPSDAVMPTEDVVPETNPYDGPVMEEHEARFAVNKEDAADEE